MKLKTQLSLCVALSTVLTVIMTSLTFEFAGEGWFSFGPSEHLIIAGVVIDTTLKYSILVCIVVFNSTVDMLINEFAQPILGFNIYNPDKRVITDFRSKSELQILANLFWASNNFRKVFEILISISQVDLALIKWLTLEITAVYTIHALLSKKIFKSADDSEEVEIELLNKNLETIEV